VGCVVQLRVHGPMVTLRICPLDTIHEHEKQLLPKQISSAARGSKASPCTRHLTLLGTPPVSYGVSHLVHRRRLGRHILLDAECFLLVDFHHGCGRGLRGRHGALEEEGGVPSFERSWFVFEGTCSCLMVKAWSNLCHPCAYATLPQRKCRS
jgi:hypothetical protein